MTPIQYIIKADDVLAALAAGCRWVQLTDRASDVPPTLIDECHQAQCYLLLTDDVEGCKTIGADGVVLSTIADSAIPAARKVLGEDSPMFLGAVVRDSVEAITAAKSGVDFVQAPVADAPAIAELIRERNLTVPVVALGVTATEQVVPLLDAGVSGIAVDISAVAPVEIPVFLAADE